MEPVTLRGPFVSAVIPCLDEESAIGAVVTAVLAQGVSEVIVVDGGSSDATATRAAEAGARVVIERQRGYGRALQTGIAALDPNCEIIVFLDGDGSDSPQLVPALVAPIAAGEVDFALGSRVRGTREPGSLSPQQVAAASIGSALLRLVYGSRFSDLSPFRAIRRDVLSQLGMRNLTYGWNLEMLMRVAASKLRSCEIPVGQRRRVGGRSKISGSAVAGLKAASVMGLTFLRLWIQLRSRRKI
jgi:glycosyltransferase involved in cell wall biosynthesis